MNERDELDRILAESAGDLPPAEDTLRAVTPWRKAMDRVVLGLCLTCFSLNVLYLQYLLPAIGAIQLYLGFRSLRRENRWFFAAFVLSAAKAALTAANLLLLATPWRLPDWAGAVSTAMAFGLLICFRQGLRRLGPLPLRQDGALWVCVWYGVMIAFALLWPKPGWVPFLAMVYAFSQVVRSLFRAAETLEDRGYALAAAPVRLSAGRALWGYLLGLLGLILLLTLAMAHRPLAGTVIEHNFDDPDTAALRAELTDLGFPAELADQLLPEDLELLSGAVACDSQGVGGLPLGNDQENVHQNRVAALRYPDGTVRVVHSFREDGGFWRNQYGLIANTPLEGAVVRLFYTRGGVTYAAPLAMGRPVLEEGLSYFGDRYQQAAIDSEVFSWPLGSRDRRGYAITHALYPESLETSVELPLISRQGLPCYPYQPHPDRVWRYGLTFYFGDGSSLKYKADEAGD